MKNKYLFLYLAGVISLISCGTTSHASYSGNGYQNGIYYTPDANETKSYAQDEQELKNLQNKTTKSFNASTQYSNYDKKTGVETIYVGDTNLVNIDYNPNITYSLVDNDESYEARIKKFDSPTYTVNIELNNNQYGNYYPLWEMNFGWYRPYWMTMGTGWYNPWWGSYYSWYGPSWGNPWYGPSWGFGWNNWYGCYDPWYYGGGWGGWYDPWYGPGPGPGHNHSNRDVYYGRRESSPSYNNRPGTNNRNGGSYTRREPSINQIGGGSRPNYAGNTSNTNNNLGSSQGNTGGSSYRRGGSQNYNGAIFNNNIANKGQTSSQPNYKPSGTTGNNAGSMYRRSANTTNNTLGTSSSANSTQRRANNTYNYDNSRNNNNGSNYNRGSSTRSSTFSTGSSYSGNTNSGTTSSGSSGSTRSSGSSYRR
ncbi:MAG: hypothetical protein RSC28_06345 [Bacteroidales bacterium]